MNAPTELRQLLVLAAAFLWLQGCGGPTPTASTTALSDGKAETQAFAPEPGFERVKVTRTRDDGSLRWVLESERGVGTEEGDWTCQGVDLTLYDERQQAYKVTARDGEVKGTQQKGAASATLKGDVTLLTEDGARITTEEAAWNEEAQTLSGDKTVHYDKQNVSCVGSGFVAKYAQKEIEVFDVDLSIVRNEGE